MLQCPQCNKSLMEMTRQCPSCRADLDLLVDYVSHLQGGLDRAENLTALGSGSWYRRDVLHRNGLKPGMSAEATIAIGSTFKPMLTVPVEALVGSLHIHRANLFGHPVEVHDVLQAELVEQLAGLVRAEPDAAQNLRRLRPSDDLARQAKAGDHLRLNAASPGECKEASEAFTGIQHEAVVLSFSEPL